MTGSATWTARRGELTTYFDRTAAEAWARLTSDAPVSGIRATVRAGRDAMRATLLSWLPEDLTGRTLLDAGCGTGALSVEAAKRGAKVTAIDVAGTLVSLAGERADPTLGIDFRVGDMLSAELGVFDHIVAMDSLIHYRAEDIAAAVTGLAARARHSVVFTVAPRTAMLTVMHSVGKLFPRSDRAPSIEPVRPATIQRLLAAERLGRTHRVGSGFYTSQAIEVLRP